MTDKNEIMNDIYDYLFENDANIGTNIMDEFPDSFIDNSAGTIHLLGSKKIGDYILTIKKITN